LITPFSDGESGSNPSFQAAEKCQQMTEDESITGNFPFGFISPCIQSAPQPRWVHREEPLCPELSSEALVVPIELAQQVGFMRAKRWV